MLCIGSKSFIYALARSIFAVPPKEAADMFTLTSALDGIREAALYCAGSPHSRIRQLAALRKLDAHLLQDIGLTADEAKRGYALRAPQRQEAPRLLQVGRFTWNR